MTRQQSQSRKGTVLLAVLVVVVLLSLAIYQYSELTLAEYKTADLSERQAQTLSLAESGVHYAAALLSNADSMASLGNPHHNPSRFSSVKVAGNGGYEGTFTLMAPPDLQDSNGAIRHGVIDESGKINLNSLLAWDQAAQAKGMPAGQLAVAMLQGLPNMTADIAAAIVDYVDADDTALSNGAESDYYMGLNPPYRCKNRPLDSLEELLLVRGVTPELLFGQGRKLLGGGGADNGTQDLGWSAYLTVYSREQTVGLDGTAWINLNADDLAKLSTDLQPLVGPSMTNFIILCRLYGATSTSTTTDTGTSGTSGSSGSSSGTGSGTGSGGTTGASSSGSATGGSSSKTTQPPIDPAEFTPDLTQKPKKQITSLFDLVNAQVKVPAADAEKGGIQGSGSSGNSTSKSSGGSSSSASSSSKSGDSSKTGEEQKPDVVFASPLNDPGNMTDLFNILYKSTFTEKTLPTTSGASPTDIPARININTAPAAVLQSLSSKVDQEGNPVKLLTDVQAQNIVTSRPSLTSDQPLPDNFATPLWLMTQLNFDAKTMSRLSPYITTRSQVFRVHVQGQLAVPGPTARVEAIIDTNGGQPRVLARRNLTGLDR